jgi:hypothetical protein
VRCGGNAIIKLPYELGKAELSLDGGTQLLFAAVQPEVLAALAIGCCSVLFCKQ